MIGDDDVGDELAQGLDHAVSRLDPAERADDVGAADFALRQGGVLRVVLDHEDPHRGGHRAIASGAWGACRCVDSSSSRSYGLPSCRYGGWPVRPVEFNMGGGGGPGFGGFAGPRGGRATTGLTNVS